MSRKLSAEELRRCLDARARETEHREEKNKNAEQKLGRLWWVSSAAQWATASAACRAHSRARAGLSVVDPTEKQWIKTELGFDNSSWTIYTKRQGQ